MITLSVESQVVREGRLQPDADPVRLTFFEEEITVADLIRRTVEEQVRQVNAQHRLREVDGETSEVPATTRDKVDAAPEVQRAQRAFSRGNFLVLVDGAPATNLSDTLSFAPGTNIRFVRLTPLVGG